MSALTGGSKLAKVLAEIGESMEASVKVGFMPNARYPDADNTYVAQVAFWNEFGTTRIPPRPFFRTMISQESPQWPALMAKAAPYYNYDGEQVLTFMGEKIKEQLQSSINGWTTPGNSDYTIARKGFDSPLRDTMHMHDSVDYEVNADD